MTRPHKEVLVKVNARCDEGIAPLVQALSKIPELETLESCQGEPGEAHAFVVFTMRRGWQAIGDFLFRQLLPALPPDIRATTSLRVESYDSDVARGWIECEPGALGAMVVYVQTIAAFPQVIYHGHPDFPPTNHGA